MLKIMCEERLKKPELFTLVKRSELGNGVGRGGSKEDIKLEACFKYLKDCPVNGLNRSLSHEGDMLEQ